MSNKYVTRSSIFRNIAMAVLALSMSGSTAFGKIEDGRHSEHGQWSRYFPISASYLNPHWLEKFDMPVEAAIFRSHISRAFEKLQTGLKAAAAQMPAEGLQSAPRIAPLQAVPVPVSLPRASRIPQPVARPAFRAPSRPRNVPGNYGVLSSVAIGIKNLPARKDWLSVSKGDHTGMFRQSCRGSATVCKSALATGVAAAVSRSKALPMLDRVSRINRAVNRALDYQTDQQIFGRPDYWATPDEVAVLGVADCEDFAIAKLWALRAIGLAPEQLQFIVIKDTRRKVLHAVLAVHLDGKAYILDSLSDTIATPEAFRNYKPIMSFAADKSYIHGFDAKAVKTANRADGQNKS